MQSKKAVALAFVMLFLLIFLYGCGGDKENRNKMPGDNKGGEAAVDINALTAEWAESAHSNILLAPAQRDGCVVCHDGGAFAMKQTELASIERDFFISVDCRACHTGQGVELMEAGSVEIPTAENVKGGSGALCMYCHNSRTAPQMDDKDRVAPHYSSQADIASGTGGIRREDFEYGNTAAHVDIDNSCVGCHMTEADGGYAAHSFQVENVENACGQCHQEIADVNLKAGGDYDGDGETEGFQTEVEGILALVQEAIVDELNGGSFTSSHGTVVFKDAEGTELSEVPDELYQAAYNYLLVSNDGSLGIHNPTLVVQLLQQSYKVLKGEDIPKAKLK